MQIVITLKDTTHKAITTLNTISEHLQDEVVRAIKNGTTLPKGHGRLIDADELLGQLILHSYSVDFCISHHIENSVCLDIAKIHIADAPTIIDADKEVENADSD